MVITSVGIPARWGNWVSMTIAVSFFCVRACMRACVRACEYVCVCVCVCVCGVRDTHCG